jgi:hypothetical protein
MADTMKIKPVEGRSLPLESNPRKRIERECEVPASSYYRRAIDAGDIQLASAPAAREEK